VAFAAAQIIIASTNQITRRRRQDLLCGHNGPRTNLHSCTPGRSCPDKGNEGMLQIHVFACFFFMPDEVHIISRELLKIVYISSKVYLLG
jgi:hypothetical protein